MKTLFTTLILTVLLTSCTLFENKKKKAIEICQKAKAQVLYDNAVATMLLNIYGLNANATWLDYANMMAKQEVNKKFDWHAEKTNQNTFYIVSFTDQEGWGQRWEVDIDQQIVKNINQNEYLTRKYGLSRFGGNDEFEVTKIQESELKVDKNNGYLKNSQSSNIYYIIKASVLNKTGKIITSAKVDGKLKLIFKDKTITGESNYESGFKSIISESRPWEANTTREFYIKTEGIDKIYQNYTPEFVVFVVSLKAEDPIGYSFDQDITDMDLLGNWKSFSNNPGSSSSKEVILIKELTAKWNDYLNTKNLQSLASLYADKISIYGTTFTKEKAINNKKEFLSKNVDFEQSIQGEIKVAKITDLQYQVFFPKSTTFNGKTIEVMSYLLFEKVSGNWKITIESDDVTDKKNRKQPSISDNSEHKACIDIAMEILRTSPVYQKRTKGLAEAIVKNGGISFGIIYEGSPNPEKDESMSYSETYDFSLHESYPDRIVTIARFTFDPTARQLYELDEKKDKLNPIAFDRSLLTVFLNRCK